MKSYKIYIITAAFGILNLLASGIHASAGQRALLLGFGIAFTVVSIIGLVVSIWEATHDPMDKLSDEAINERWGK